MVNRVLRFGIQVAVVAFFAVLVQFFFKARNLLGYGREVDSITAYSHARCQKLENLGLEGCEDMWLHQKTGFLYMACSNSDERVQWLPAIDHLNATGRGSTDRVAVLDTRGSGSVASRLQWLTVENFSGNNGDGALDLHGLDIRADKNTDTLRILLVNHRPPIDPVTGEILDATKLGANSTVEQFQTKAGSPTMRHVRTYANEAIQTPNRVAWVSDHSFVFTNDHSGKVGLRRNLDLLIGGGSVGYCDRSRCNIAYSSGFHFPNGLTQGRDGLIYVPNTADTNLDVFDFTEPHLLKKVHTIKNVPPIDNLVVDGNGDIYAAAFPKLHIFGDAGEDPRNINPPAAVYKISRTGKGYTGTSRKANIEAKNDGDYVVEKVLEDNGSVLPGATVAVHDSETGRIFVGGSMAPYVSICETR